MQTAHLQTLQGIVGRISNAFTQYQAKYAEMQASAGNTVELQRQLDERSANDAAAEQALQQLDAAAQQVEQALAQGN